MATAVTVTVNGGTGTYTFSDQHISGGVFSAKPNNIISDLVAAVNKLQSATGPLQAPSYLKAALPTGTAGQYIYVSNATGKSVTGSLCFYNGTSWIDVTTGVAVV